MAVRNIILEMLLNAQEDSSVGCVVPLDVFQTNNEKNNLLDMALGSV
jgi:hypothetical protein